MSQQHTTHGQRPTEPRGRRSSDSGITTEKGNPRPEPYRPGPMRHGGQGGHFTHGRGGPDTKSNGMGSRGGALAGRNHPAGARREGAFDEDFNKLVLCLVGQIVEVQKTDGSVYQGIFHTREAVEGREFGVVLKMARLVREMKDGKATSKSEAVKDASRMPPMKTVYIHHGDFVQIVAKDVPLSSDALANGSLRNLDDVMTDTGISRRRTSFEGRELKPWKPEASDLRSTEHRLEGPISGTWGSGGSSNSSGRWDQFATNRDLFGVHTTFDENFYTTPLEKGNDAQSRQREREAARIAREIEQSVSKNPHLAEERGQKAAPEIEALDEEERFSSVRREDTDAQANEDEHDLSIDDRNAETFGDVGESKEDQAAGNKPSREAGSSPDDPSDLFKEHLQLRLHVPATRKVPKSGSPYNSPVGRRSPLTSPLVAGDPAIQALNLDPSRPHVSEEVLKDFHEFKKSIREDSAQMVKDARDHQTNELRSFSETYGKGLKKDAEGSPRMGSPRIPRTPSNPEAVRSATQETSPPELSRSGSAKHREQTSRTSSPSGDVRRSDAIAAEARKQRAQSPASIAQKAAAAAAAAATAQAAPPEYKASNKAASKQPVSGPSAAKPSSPASFKPIRPSTGDAPSGGLPSKPSTPMSRTTSAASEAASVASSGTEGSTPAKSKLNPNAKEFKFNPGAKEFVPGSRPSSASSHYSNRPIASPQHGPHPHPPSQQHSPQQPVFMHQGMPPPGIPPGQYIQQGQYNQFQMQQMQPGAFIQQPQFVPGGQVPGQPMMPGQPGMRPPQGQQQPMYQQQMGFPQGPPMQPGQPGFMQYPGVQQFPQQQPGQQFVRMPNGQFMPVIMNPQYMQGQPMPLPGQPPIPIPGQPQQPPQQQQQSPQQQKIRGGMPPQQGMPFGAPFAPGQPPPPHLQQGPIQHPHMHPGPQHIQVLPGAQGGHPIVQASPPMGPGKKGPQ